MSPEQVRGKAVDRRSDIFSFGCVFYEMLSGQQPFRKETPTDTMAAILKDDPPEISRLDASLPDGNSYPYSYPQELSELQWVEGFK